ncbi:hypothetical protein VTI28DRAFT_2881 [Corynascus sepedonium]
MLHFWVSRLIFRRNLRAEVREWIETEIEPHVTEWDEKKEVPAEVYKEMGRRGGLRDLPVNACRHIRLVTVLVGFIHGLNAWSQSVCVARKPVNKLKKKNPCSLPPAHLATQRASSRQIGHQFWPVDEPPQAFKVGQDGNTPKLGESFVEFTVVKHRSSNRHRILLRISHAQYDGVCFPKILNFDLKSACRYLENENRNSGS